MRQDSNTFLTLLVLSTLWQQFGKGPFLFQHDRAQRGEGGGHKYVVEQGWGAGTQKPCMEPPTLTNNIM